MWATLRHSGNVKLSRSGGGGVQEDLRELKEDARALEAHLDDSRGREARALSEAQQAREEADAQRQAVRPAAPQIASPLCAPSQPLPPARPAGIMKFRPALHGSRGTTGLLCELRSMSWGCFESYKYKCTAALVNDALAAACPRAAGPAMALVVMHALR